ncbi:hypothetical protein NL676_024125 [Syzygium grande]|nr:hypothetical protein NL676_024125 [Syzygium grande]
MELGGRVKITRSESNQKLTNPPCSGGEDGGPPPPPPPTRPLTSPRASPGARRARGGPTADRETVAVSSGVYIIESSIGIVIIKWRFPKADAVKLEPPQNKR